MRSGLGIRPELFGPVEDIRPAFGFLEAHSENYFGESISRAKLLSLREDYPISLHGVGLSLGRADNLSQQHLAELKRLVDEVEPMLVSEHLAWSAYSHQHVPDLLPLPLNGEALDIICQHVDQMQSVLGMQILLENPSNYLLFEQLQIPEPDFLNTVAVRTGCALLIDVNNVHVSASNLGMDGRNYIEKINSRLIGQYHLAGYTEVTKEHGGITECVLIDTHNHTVYDPVWGLFEHTLELHGARPTLIEWDSDFPAFETLQAECSKADEMLARHPHPKDRVTPSRSIKAIDSAPALDASQANLLAALFTVQPELESACAAHKHRLWIYQNNVFGALQDYLSEVYPATKGVVGEDYFKQIVHAFVQQSPPELGNVHLYGQGLISQCEHVQELADLSYLPQLMRYEWALHCAYFAMTSNALDPESMPQDQLLTSCVRYNDSVCLLNCDSPVYEIHRQSLPNYSGEVAIDLNQSQDKLLIYKVNHKVITRLLDAEQLEFLQQLEKNQNLLQAIEHVQGSISEQTLSATLSLVFEASLLSLA